MDIGFYIGTVLWTLREEYREDGHKLLYYIGTVFWAMVGEKYGEDWWEVFCPGL